MTADLIDMIADGTSAINITISAIDLRRVVAEMTRREHMKLEAEIARHTEPATIGRTETAAMLGVHVNTLRRWAEDGYLMPVKVGTKVRYKLSDINEMLSQRQQS